MTQTLTQMVREFHETYGLTINKLPTLQVPATERKMRVDLITEELDELQTALDEEDIVEVADALADLLYVVAGAGLVFGIDLDAVLVEVQRSNLSKLGEDGQPLYREDGKVLKGPNFSEPDIERVLAEQVLGFTTPRKTSSAQLDMEDRLRGKA